VLGVVAAATPAWAVNERITLPTGEAPYVRQLENTLCFSMQCIGADHLKGARLDAAITAKLIKSKSGTELELQVKAPSGAVKTTVKVPATATGHLSPTDVVTASSAIIKVLEAKEMAIEEKDTDPEKAARDERAAQKAQKAQHAKVMKKKKNPMHLALRD
jgi:hypothetical protein